MGAELPPQNGILAVTERNHPHVAEERFKNPIS
jgi:hypothetical protein